MYSYTVISRLQYGNLTTMYLLSVQREANTHLIGALIDPDIHNENT